MATISNKGPILRPYLLKLIQAELPYLVSLQKYRTSSLDWFMTWLGALGTHTFFMLAIPMLFWFELGPPPSISSLSSHSSSSSLHSSSFSSFSFTLLNLFSVERRMKIWSVLDTSPDILRTFGMDMVLILASGVYFTGVFKVRFLFIYFIFFDIIFKYPILSNSPLL